MDSWKIKKLVFLFAIVGLAPLFAQVPPPETVEQTRPGTVPQLDGIVIKFRQSAEVGTVESVQRAPVPDMLTLYTSQTYYHTDNLFLTTPNTWQDNAWVGTFGGSFIPYSTYRWTPRLTVEAALVRFDRASPVDYNGQTIAFDNRLGLTDNNLVSWNLVVSALRLEGEHAGVGEFYKRVEMVNNLNWFVPLGHAGRWALHLSPGVSLHSAQPASEDRLDTGANVGVLWFANRAVAFEPFFDAGYTYYPNDSLTLLDRRDVHLRGGVNGLWTISEHASVGASAYWLANYSGAAGGDYQILPNVTLNLRFGF